MSEQNVAAAQPAPKPVFDFNKLQETIVNAVAQAVVAAQEKVRPIESFQAPKISVFNPTGGVKPTLTRKIFFCGAEEQEDNLTPEEITLYNQVKPGRYNKRKWEVIERESENDDPNVLEIRIPVSDINNRMELPSEGLRRILQMMIAEASAGKAPSPAVA